MGVKVSVNDLFFVFQEPDLDNEEIYLPADTPAGKVNPKRLRAIYMKQHARQRERLLNQQIAELDKYRRDFATNFKDDLSITPPSEIACELISGPDFLVKNDAQIMELLTMIPDMASPMQQDFVMTKVLDEEIPEVTPLALSPPQPIRPEGPSDDDMDTSEDEMPLNNVDDKHDGNGDEAIQSRKEKYSMILKKKYKKNFSKFRKIHALQYKKLQEIQKENLAAIPDDTPLPSLSLSAPTQPEIAVERKDTRFKGKEKEKEKYRQLVGGQANDQQREALNSAHHTTQHLLNVLKQKMDFNTTKPNGLKQKGSLDKDANQILKSHRSKPGSKISKNATTSKQLFDKTKAKLPSVVISQPLPVASSKPPMVTSSGPPVVATSSSNSNNSCNSNHSNSRGGNQGRRDSNQPLFYSRPKMAKPKTLMDNNNGFITVKNKPDRVIINGHDYGTPKDFDDAINGISQGDNAIHKRHLCGENYLYYKSPKGRLIALGTVSKIQPYIHKFLLSK
ncbi:hypothetical protein BD408DRAFT_443272 [Parasitella parasitica]|nr:hypothetical protein BD408DRAFT_443272 [Parasitella parasitica]